MLQMRWTESLRPRLSGSGYEVLCMRKIGEPESFKYVDALLTSKRGTSHETAQHLMVVP